MLRISIAVLAVLLVAAATANAEVRVGRAPVGAIQLAGRSVVYDEETFSIEDAEVVDYADRIVRRRPGRARRVIAEPASSVDTLNESGYDDLGWDASASGLLTGVGSTNYEAADSETGARVFGGLFGSKPTRFSNCFEGTYGGTPSVALWGKLAAYTDDCASRTRPLIVRRLDHPHEAPLFKREVGDSEIDLAGNYVAIGNYFDRKAGIEVVDWRDGKTLYTVAADLWADQERAGTFELQPDGKLAAVVVGRGHYCEAAWFSPPSPQAHVMGRTACGADIRLSSDQLAWMRIGKRRGELVVTPLDGIGQTVARFAAIPPAPKAELYSGTTVSQSFAWDGEQLAYSVDRCDGRSTLLLRHHVAGPVFNDRAPLGCPWHLASRVLHLKRGSKSVGVPLRCPRGCEGTMQVTGGHPSIDEPFRLRPGRRYARLFLTDNTRLSLARHGTAEIRLEIDSGGRLGGSRREVRLRLYTR